MDQYHDRKVTMVKKIRSPIEKKRIKLCANAMKLSGMNVKKSKTEEPGKSVDLSELCETSAMHAADEDDELIINQPVPQASMN